MADLPRGLSPPPVIFHITARGEWEAARPTGSYTPAGFASEGFIHLSVAQQVARVANARFAGAGDLVLLCVAVERVGAPLRYEPGEGGNSELFPHLYGPLEVNAVLRVVPFVEGPGGFVLPPEAAAPGAAGP